MILNDETEFCNKYARSSNGEMDVIPFREVSWRNYRWTHFGEFLQSLHHILILLSSEKCYSSQGVFEFVSHPCGPLDQYNQLKQCNGKHIA